MSDSNNSGGLGLFAVLGIVFVILKLTGNIAWSWWLVLLPFWGPIALALVIAIIAAPFVYFAKRRVVKKINNGEFDFDSLFR